MAALNNAEAGTVVSPTPSYSSQPGPACVTSLTQSAAGVPTPSSSISCNSGTGGNYCGMSEVMTFTTPSNGGVLCPGKYSASGYCMQITQGGCSGGGGGQCGWGVAIYAYPSGTQLAGSSSIISGCSVACGSSSTCVCPNSSAGLQTATFTYDTNTYQNVYMEDTSESAGASTSYCVVTMIQSQAY